MNVSVMLVILPKMMVAVQVSSDSEKISYISCVFDVQSRCCLMFYSHDISITKEVIYIKLVN